MVDYELGRRPQRTLSGSLKRVGGAEAGNDSVECVKLLGNGCAADSERGRTPKRTLSGIGVGEGKKSL